MVPHVLSIALSLIQFAPLIARFLGGNQSVTVAQEIVDIAQKLTGHRDNITDLADTFSKNPQLLLEFQKEMIKLSQKFDQAEIMDRSNARWRDLALFQAGHKNLRADIMVLCAAIGLIFCLISLVFFKETLPGEAVGIISTVAGIFGSCLKDAYAFEFGSSRGSKEKDERVTAIISGFGELDKKTINIR